MADSKETSDPEGKRAIPRWSGKEIETMVKIVRNAPNRKDGFAKASEALGRGPAAVQMKFYALERGNKAHRKRPAKNAAKVAEKAVQAPQKESFQSFSNASTEQLVTLIEEARGELRRRAEMILAVLGKANG